MESAQRPTSASGGSGGRGLRPRRGWGDQPSTTTFPADPTALERESLDAAYRSLRSSCRSLMVSRGLHRSQAHRPARGLRAGRGLAKLEIVTGVIGDLEDASDDLVNQFAACRKGWKSYAGGSFIPRLIHRR